jgi:hypothetical protein
MEKCMNKIIILLILSFLGYNIFPEEIKIWPEIIGLNEFIFPEVMSNEWYKLNHAIKIYYIDDFGAVTITTERISQPTFLKVTDGEFIGVNKGEWGGKLYFENDEYKYTIINENICGIFKYNNEIYVLTGLAHGFSQYGKIIKLEKIDGVYSISHTIEITKEPQLFKIYNDIVYIITYDGLITFDGKEIVEILKDQPWGSLASYPSLFINEEIIALGLRGCIIILENNNIRAYR